MLDTETKRRIDTARDILVGKVPDPKSQVEQITIALIYKFMDDMDAESEELGGNRKFFAGEFAQYGWPRLVRAGLGGHEVLNLYAEAITRMPENPGIPPLFRDIFKNAFLPYRDPETLRAFLKVIDEFEYDHSERLGDAFEYLLSVLGSQGDAGQFRTPRHIIDFIVSIVDPKKDKTILDPACGTAGFLISSYKHILMSNTDDKGHSTLTPDEKGKLADNFKGYDISPDMVRLSLVNLYLHGFVAPQVHEYDTLTSEERWNEYADVILANPPFMTPKGGIRPHNRFSVKSKRSEVLFVDYMAEHLTPNGRAGIIVPEGIIFQSQNAYKQLRKMLVEEYLVAVVSLPAGVFNPYSGVKTSTLILDKALARRRDRIGFFKVENDGFDLGAQRRAINENDLPEIRQAVGEYLNMDEQDKDSSAGMLDKLTKQGSAQIVAKEKIAKNGEYNLSVERYRENKSRLSRFPIVPLGEVAEVIAGQSPPGKSYNDAGTGTPFYQGKTEFGQMFIGEPTKWTTDPQRFADAGDILMSVRAPVGPVNFATQKICIGRGLAAIKPIDNHLLPSYAFYILRSQEADITGNTGAAFASINKNDIKKIEIPLPPLEAQREIVAEIEGYQKVIDGARTVIENYRPHITIDPGWPFVTLGDSLILEYGKPLKAENRIQGPYPVFGSNGIVGYHNEYLTEGPVIIVGRKGSAGAVNFCESPCYPIDTTFFVRIREQQQLDIRFCYYQMLELELDKINIQSGVPGLNRNDAYLKKIALPSLKTQQALVTEIEAEQTLVTANQKLIERMEVKIKEAINRVWGKIED